MTRPRRRARWILAAIAVVVAVGALVVYEIREPILARWWLHELVHRDWTTRHEAAERLLELRRPETVDPMVEMIRAGDHGERYPPTQAAAWVLAGLGGLALDRVLELASDPRVSVRYLALEALAYLAERPDRWDGVPEMAASVARWKTHAVPPTEAEIQTALGALAEALNDPEAEIREKAASGLASAVVDPSLRGTLVRALKDPNLDVFWYAASALGGPPELSPEELAPVVDRLRDSDPLARHAALVALVWHRPKTECVLEAVLHAAEDPDPRVRSQVPHALAALAPDDPRTREALERLSRDPDKEVHREARYRLKYAREVSR